MAKTCLRRHLTKTYRLPKSWMPFFNLKTRLEDIEDMSLRHVSCLRFRPAGRHVFIRHYQLSGVIWSFIWCFIFETMSVFVWGVIPDYVVVT